MEEIFSFETLVCTYKYTQKTYIDKKSILVDGKSFSDKRERTTILTTIMMMIKKWTEIKGERKLSLKWLVESVANNPVSQLW